MAIHAFRRDVRKFRNSPKSSPRSAPASIYFPPTILSTLKRLGRAAKTDGSGFFSKPPFEHWCSPIRQDDRALMGARNNSAIENPGAVKRLERFRGVDLEAERVLEMVSDIGGRRRFGGRGRPDQPGPIYPRLAPALGRSFALAACSVRGAAHPPDDPS